MKKLLSVVFLLSLVVSLISVTPNVKAIMAVPEGATIKTADNPDVYIVKYKNGKQFKRLVLNPQVFESYGHLRWEDILTVSQSEIDSFIVSDLVRVDGQTDIYQLVPNGDVGTKVLLTSTAGYDLDLVYTINGVDFGNYIKNETVSQKNAVKKAKTYLNYSAFSRDGLVGQLEYEKFTNTDAVYGADNSGADWNEQAIKKAKTYLEYSAFSYDGLVDQLLYEKFTQAQAEYGADNSFIQE